jgi:hypothetical protein
MLLHDADVFHNFNTCFINFNHSCPSAPLLKVLCPIFIAEQKHVFLNAAFHTPAVSPVLHKLYKRETSIHCQVFLVPDRSLNKLKYLLLDMVNRTLTLVAPRIPKDNFQFSHNWRNFCYNSVNKHTSCNAAKLRGSENSRYVQITKATSLGHLVVERQRFMPSEEVLINKKKFVLLSLLGTACHSDLLDIWNPFLKQKIVCLFDFFVTLTVFLVCFWKKLSKS